MEKRILFFCLVSMFTGCAGVASTNSHQPVAVSPAPTPVNLSVAAAAPRQSAPAPRPVNATVSDDFVAYVAAGSKVAGVQIDRPTLIVGMRHNASTWIKIMAEDGARHRGSCDPLPNKGGYACESGELCPYQTMGADGLKLAFYDMSCYDEAIRTRVHAFSFYGMTESGNWLAIAPGAGWHDASSPGMKIVCEQRYDGTHAFGIEPEGGSGRRSPMTPLLAP